MKAVYASEDQYLDIARSRMLMVVDIAQTFPKEEIRTTFVAKEHYIIDKKVIVRPMPKFFSAEYYWIVIWLLS